MDDRGSRPRAPATIWTVVVTFNAAAVIRRCLDSLRDSEMSTSVVVVDNSSTDNTAAVVQDEYPEVNLVEAGVNLGFGAACNLGAHLAGATADSYIFFLNPDASVAPGCIGTLASALARDERLGVVSPLLIDHATGTIRYAGADLDVDELRFDVHDWGEDPAGSRYVFEYTGRPTGAAMLVRGAILDEVGPMDPTYFLYWEETEWALRMDAGGYAIGFEPAAIAHHESSHSTGGSGSKVMEYYFARNFLRMVRDATGDGVLRTSWRVRPQLVQRVVDRLHARDLRSALRTARWVATAYLDFWRHRTGPRSALHSTGRGA
jgi:N-acetylglucosaminyl-diphospho-decaprenol L-rhamnosyltransferase